MKLAFFGAAGTVTGSCYRLQTEAGNILVDCGLFQGRQEIKERNYRDFCFEPQEIDAVLLTHAHIDHCGLIPKLYKDGYKGKVYTTTVTKDLCTIMLPDTAHIQEMEVEQKNRKLKRRNSPLLEPIYNTDDAEYCLQYFEGFEYDQEIEILPGFKVIFRDAGHILGSAMIEISAEDTKFVFSGDIGNDNQPIIEDPSIIREGDYVIMESTYGNRLHRNVSDRSGKLKKIINEAMDRGGNLIVPSFALERTQELLYEIRKLILNREIPEVNVYVDSPLAIRATEIFAKYANYFDEEASEIIEKGDSIFKFPNLKFTLTAEESLKLNDVRNNSIIISASGMADAGRIRHHLKHNLWRPESTVLFVGYQAAETLGRRIIEGAEVVTIHGEEVAVNAKIEKLDGFSGHADQEGLVNWVKGFKKPPRAVFITHGEEEAAETIAKLIEKMFGYNVHIAEMQEEIELTAAGIKYEGGVKIASARATAIAIRINNFEKDMLQMLEGEKAETFKEEMNAVKKILGVRQ